MEDEEITPEKWAQFTEAAQRFYAGKDRVLRDLQAATSAAMVVAMEARELMGQHEESANVARAAFAKAMRTPPSGG